MILVADQTLPACQSVLANTTYKQKYVAFIKFIALTKSNIIGSGWVLIVQNLSKAHSHETAIIKIEFSLVFVQGYMGVICK